MEPVVRPLLQLHGHHRLRDPIGDRRHTKHADPVAVRLRDLHRPHPGREMEPTHPIPDLVEVVHKIGLELLEILPAYPRRALVGLDPPPRLPHHRLGNRKRLVFGLPAPVEGAHRVRAACPGAGVSVDITGASWEDQDRLPTAHQSADIVTGTANHPTRG